MSSLRDNIRCNGLRNKLTYFGKQTNIALHLEFDNGKGPE